MDLKNRKHKFKTIEGQQNENDIYFHNLKRSLDSIDESLIITDTWTNDYINKLIIAYKKSPKNSIATKYKHGVGVPALFSQASFKELSLLSQDFGAKDILRKEENQRIDILPNFDTTDIDTEKSYNLLNF